MEYCSHIWGGFPGSQGFDLLDRVQKRVVSSVVSELSSDLQAVTQEGCCKLSHRWGVASPCLFYKYYYGKCSSELADLVPPKRVPVRSTHSSEQMHRHTVNSPMCRTKYYQSNLFPRTAALWNSLANECFPPDYDLTAFKGRVQGEGSRGGFKGRVQGEGSRGGFKGRVQGEGSRGGFKGRVQGEGSRGGFKGRVQGEGSRGGFKGRVQGEGSRGGFKGRVQGEGSRGGFKGRVQGEGSRGGLTSSVAEVTCNPLRSVVSAKGDLLKNK